MFQAATNHLAEGHYERVPETPCQKAHFYNYLKDNQPPWLNLPGMFGQWFCFASCLTLWWEACGWVRVCNPGVSHTRRRWARSYSAKQVWSLPHPHSIAFSQSRLSVKSAVLKNAQSRFAKVVLDSVLAPPSPEQHTWSCPWFSVVPEASHEVSRGPFKGPGHGQGSCWEVRTREVFPPT